MGWSSGRSFWTKYCLLCTICGSAATILAGIFLVVAALFRYYTTSLLYFETVPTYVPAILLSICGVSTIAFSCKRNRNIILLRITACWSLVSAALSSVITITTSLIHMNRLQTLKECVYNRNPPACTCFGHSYSDGPLGPEPIHFVFENTVDCDVIHGALYSCLRAVFAISVVAVLLSIFLTMLLYQLIGHERKKAYWSRIRRINSDWSSDFLACLARPMGRERSSLMPLMLPTSSSLQAQGLHWGPPPPYEALSPDDLLPLRRSSSFTPHTHTVALPPPSLSNSSSAQPFSPTIRALGPFPPPTQGPSSPPTFAERNLRLRESKISIESASDNLYSQDEESFAESRLPFEPKVINVHVTLNLSRRSSSNFDFLEKGLPAAAAAAAAVSSPQRAAVAEHERNRSLPSSPFLSNMRRMLKGVKASASPTARLRDRNWDLKDPRASSCPGSPLKLTGHPGSSGKDSQLC